MTVMPIGATILYSSIAAVFVAQIFNVDLSLGQQLAMLGALMVTSKRASA